MAGLSLGPLVEARSIHHDLSIGSELHMRAIHGTRRRAFKIDAFTVLPAGVTRILEFVFAGFPVGRAAEMRAARVNHKDAIGRAIHPNAIFLLPLRIDAKGVIREVANFENSGRLKQRARKEKTQKSDEPCAQETSDPAPHQSPPPFIELTVLWPDRGHPRRSGGFGGADGGSAHVACGVSRARGARCRRVGFRSVFAPGPRHAIPPYD